MMFEWNRKINGEGWVLKLPHSGMTIIGQVKLGKVVVVDFWE